ncbi:MAG: 4-vinyl reductase [Armatimonadetes bacterium]|nr:4-vinyl reductase [Anaerolineae bacterium]
MVHITPRPDDPVAQLRVNDAYMRWALEAAEEVVGHEGLAVVLRSAGLEKFIENYPPDNLEPPGSGITFGDYTKLNAGLLTFYGRPAKGMVMRIGRVSARKGIEHQSGVFNLGAVLAAKLMPSSTQVKMGLVAMLSGFKTIAEKFGQGFEGSITDGGEYWIFTLVSDPTSAGIYADGHVGWLMEGTIEETGRIIFGKFFDVTQVACRAMGDPASVWHVPKEPTVE